MLTRPTGIAITADGWSAWFDVEQLAASPAIRGLLEDAGVAKQGHDLKRQDVALRTLGVRLAGQAFDTLLAAYLLEAGERNLGLVETAIRHGVPGVDPAAAAALEHPAAWPA